MPLAETDLFEVVNAGVPRNSATLFAEVREAVRHMHAVGVAHMDLKLENVVLRQGVAQVIDLGLSVDVPATLRNTRCLSKCMGTRSYGAPEIWHNEAYDPFRADVWSLGIVGYALHHNHLLFHATINTDQDFRRVANDQAAGKAPSEAVQALRMWRTQQTSVPPLPEWIQTAIDEMLWVDADRRVRPV